MKENARTKFAKGDRVQFSDLGRRRLRARDPGQCGTVVGFSPRHKDCVRILRDGNKQAATYHMSYWCAAPPTPTEEPIA